MSDTTRFSVSMDADLLALFLERCRKHGYENRSEALRDLIRGSLVKDEWAANEEIVGTITLVYDHHQRELARRLTRAQHEAHDIVLSSLHVHLDHDNCLEIIAVRGQAAQVQRVADALISDRGVKHGTLSATTTGRHLR